MKQSESKEEKKERNVQERIFEYDSFRNFLRDYFEQERGRSRAFSLRFFSGKAGFSSHSFLSHVLKGERKLSLDSAELIVRAIDLKEKPSGYFRALVLYNQAENYSERDRYFREMQAFRKSDPFYKVEERQYAYYSRWYLPVLREVAAMPGWKGSWERLGKMLSPAISAAQAREGVDILLEIGMLKKLAGDRFALAEEMVTAEGVPGHVFREARVQYILRALESAEKLPKEERHLSYAVFSTSRKHYESISKKLDALRKEILLSSQEEKSPDAVYAVNLQFFPLTEPEK